MADLIGKESVERFITKAGKNNMKIYRRGDGIKGTPCYISNSPDSDFVDFATMFGNSQEEYIIYLYDFEEGEEPGKGKVGGNKKAGRIQTTFCLNERQRGIAGAQPVTTHNNDGLSVRDIILLKQLEKTNQPAGNDMMAMIGMIMGITKDAHKNQLEGLTMHLEHIQRDTAKQFNAIQQRMMDQMEEEEEEEEQQEYEDAQVRMKKVELEGMKEIAKIAAPILGEIKDTIYTLAGKTPPAKIGLLRVAGPMATLGSGTATGFQIPVSDKVGEFKPFQPPPADTDVEGVNKFMADQQAKFTGYGAKISQLNAHLGDDMAVLYKMSQDMPTKFEEVIIELRKTFGYA